MYCNSVTSDAIAFLMDTSQTIRSVDWTGGRNIFDLGFHVKAMHYYTLVKFPTRSICSGISISKNYKFSKTITVAWLLLLTPLITRKMGIFLLFPYIPLWFESQLKDNKKHNLLFEIKSSPTVTRTFKVPSVFQKYQNNSSYVLPILTKLNEWVATFNSNRIVFEFKSNILLF